MPEKILAILLPHEERSARVCFLLYGALKKGERGVGVETRVGHVGWVHDRLLLRRLGDEIRRPVQVLLAADS